MDYGAFVPQGWRLDLVGVGVDEQWPAILDVAARAEAAGFGSIWAYDHFHTVPIPTQESTFECWTLMAALAAATDSVRLGQMCTSAPYRAPSLLAKMSSTIDVISGGRLEVGIGAGWYENEFRGYGYEFGAPADRVRHLGEYVSVLKRMWTEEVVDHAGEFYRLQGAINAPRPRQKPHPRLWIAGGGEKRTLALVAEHADGANFEFSVEVFEHKSQVLAEHCERIGRPFDEILRSCHVELLVGENDRDLQLKLDRVCRQRGMAPEEIRARGFVGTLGEIEDRLGRLETAGCDLVIGYFSDSVWGDGIEMIGSEVIGTRQSS